MSPLASLPLPAVHSGPALTADALRVVTDEPARRRSLARLALCPQPGEIERRGDPGAPV